MTKLKELEQLKERIETLKTEVNRSKGARDEALRNLQEEFDIETLGEAEDLLILIIKQEKKAKTKFNDALEDFNSEWGERLET